MQIKLSRLIYFALLLCIVLMTAGIGSAESVGVYDNAGTWALWNTSTDLADIVGFGWAGTEPMVGDWNADGITDIGIYNVAGNNFLLRTDFGFDVIGLGWPGVTPLVGDWNGDGADEVGVYNNEGTWALWNTETNSADIVGFGWAGTEPMVGDWNADGVTDIGIYNIAGNNFLLRTDSGFDVIGLGWSGVTPIVGDWKGDGADEVGVYNNEGTWALWNTDTNSADLVGFGWAGTEPIVGDWNLDGATELGIYDRGGNNFLLQNNSGFDVVGVGWEGVTPVVGIWNTDHAWFGSVAHYSALLETNLDEISVTMNNRNYVALATIGQKIMDDTQTALEDNGRYTVSPMFQEAQSEWALSLTDLNNVGKYTTLIAKDLKAGIDDPENIGMWITYSDSAIYHMNRAVELMSNV